LRCLAVYLVEQQFVPYGQVRELLADLLGARLSVGTLVQWVQQSAVALAAVEAQIKVALQRTPVLHSDASGVRQAGQLAWAHLEVLRKLPALRGSDILRSRSRRCERMLCRTVGGGYAADRTVPTQGRCAGWESNDGSTPDRGSAALESLYSQHTDGTSLPDV
jgi:hypothetical protein